MGTLVLTPYKPAPATPGDANQVANGFTAIEAVVNAITQANMGAGNKVTASAMSGGPPASPSDGDIWIALAVDAFGTVWQFRYNAGSASSFKWEFIGGNHAIAGVITAETTNSVAYTDLATVGPSITLARAGDYRYRFGAHGVQSTAGEKPSVSIAVTGTAASDSWGIFVVGPASTGASISKDDPWNAVPAGGVMSLKYKAPGGNVITFSQRFLCVLPIRII